MLRRPLNDTERQDLEARAAELAPVLAPYPAIDLDHVALAIADMFGSYTSMRQSGEEAGAKLDASARLLQPFPAWAIKKACIGIQTNGVFRDGKYDRRWPPNDSEILAVVQEELRHYEKVRTSAVALLTASTEAEIEARR